MGCYDNIKFEDVCPKCKAKVRGFQSKSNYCLLANLEFWEVDNFYATCEKCGTHIEYTRNKNSKRCPITEYTKVYTSLPKTI
jgi:rubrerythrin